jgi:integrase
MLFMAANIILRGRVYYFYVRIPKYLVSAYGRERVSESLHTGDVEVAKVRARKLRIELDKELDRLKAVPRSDDNYVGSVLSLSDDDIERLCERYRVKVLVDDELERIQGRTRDDRLLNIDLVAGYLPTLRDNYAEGNLKDVHSSMRDFLAEVKLRLPTHSPSYVRLARRFQQAEIEVFEALLQRHNGVMIPVPLVATDTLTIDGIYVHWLPHKPNRPPSTPVAFRKVFDEFKATCTAPSARLVKKADAAAFRNHQLASGLVGPRTVKKKLTFLRAAFQLAVADALLEVNPFAGIKVSINEQDEIEEARTPFSTKDLQTIFTSVVYQPGYTVRDSIGYGAAYWLPLLALYTGARLEELAQLSTTHVLKDPDHGWHLQVRTIDRKNPNPLKEIVPGKKHLKTASSKRNVALHPALIEMGFLEYVKTQNGSLFPNLKANKHGVLSEVY